jgi:hypothetical protein
MGAVKVYLHTVDLNRPMFLILGSAEPNDSAELCQSFREMKMRNGLRIIGRPQYVRAD